MTSVAPVDLELGEVARLEDIVDRRALGEVCRSFFELFSLSIRLVSSEGNLLADIHEQQRVCGYVNALPGGRQACSRVVSEVKRIDGREGPVLHACFTGAEYWVAPIEYQGRCLGRFIIGPYVRADLREVPRSLLTVDPGVDAEGARAALHEMPRVRRETVERIGAHLARVLDLILFSGHRSHLTSNMHVASIKESYRELVEKNTKLQEAYDKLRELDRLKSNFLATMSHELRTPLTSILGYSDMLESGIGGDLNDEQRDFVATIRGKGEHLLALISSLLDMNKLEAGTMRLSREPMVVAGVVDDLVKTITPSARKKNITLVAEVAPELRTVFADPVRLKQVLFNIAENALKFTPRDGTIRVTARPVTLEVAEATIFDVGVPAVELRIIDSGFGIPKSEHERIFDAFYQVDGSSTREHGGTGLGLSIVKRIVEAHGGRIHVESEPGQGATFVVVLPEAAEPS